MNEKWYELTPEQIANKLGSDISRGLSKTEAAARLSRYGENRIYPERKESGGGELWHIFTDLTVLLLVFSALISSVFDRSIGAVVIICVVILSTLIAVVSYLKARQILYGTSMRASPSVKAVRDGRITLVGSEQITVGDVIFLSAGDIVPADARIIQAERLTVIQSEITGEKDPVRKRAGFADSRGGEILPRHQTNMVFASSIVMSGSGRAMICAVSGDTLVGKSGKEAAPLKDRLRIFRIMSRYSSAWGLCMLVAVFAIVLLDFIIAHADRSLFDSFITALTLAVASLSSYYLAFAYIVVSCGVRNLGRSRGRDTGALLKNIEKIEAAKDITALIVPRNALIAKDAVRIERIYGVGGERRADTHGYKRSYGSLLRLAVISTGLYGAKRLVYNNLSANNMYSEDEELIIADATKYGVYNLKLDRDFPMADHTPAGEGSRFHTTLFFGGGEFRAVSRGDALHVLRHCTSYRDLSGEHRMTEEKLDELRRYVTSVAKDNCRVLAIASKKTQYTNLRRILACQSELTFEGFLVISEPLLDGAARNIKACREAGIRIIMTCEKGDVGEIAARTLGIIKDPSEIVTGKQIADMKPEIFRINIPMYNLYEGLTSAQLEALVGYMRADGACVGVISDKLDEISVLRACDVGFAQSVAGAAVPYGDARKVPIVVGGDGGSGAGTAALRYCADAVLQAPDARGHGGFNAMVGTVKTAVQSFRGILRIAAYMFMTQAARLLLVIWGVISGSFLLTPVQILFSGLVIDLAAIFIIALQPPSPHVLSRRETVEKRLKRPFFSNIRYIAYGAVWAICTAVLPYIVRAMGIDLPTEQLVSASFLGFMVTQFFVLSEVKKERSILNPNIRFNGIGALITLLCIALVILSLMVPAFGEMFGICAVKGAGLAVMLIPAAVITVVLEVDKVVRGETHFAPLIEKIKSKLRRSKKKPQTTAQKTGPVPGSSAQGEHRTVAQLFENFDLDSFIAPDRGISDEPEFDSEGADSAMYGDGISAPDTARADQKTSGGGTDGSDRTADEPTEQNKAAPCDDASTAATDPELHNFDIGNDIIESIFSVRSDED